MSAVLAIMGQHHAAPVRASITPYSAYVVDLRMQDDDGTELRHTRVVLAQGSMNISAQELAATGYVVTRMDITSAEGLKSMARLNRPRYVQQFNTYWLWRRARQLSKQPTDLIPHRDYDVAQREHDLQNWLTGEGRWVGD